MNKVKKEKEMDKVNKLINENFMYVPKEDKFLSEVIYGTFAANGEQGDWVGIHKSLFKKE